VRKSIVVLGGLAADQAENTAFTASVEILGFGLSEAGENIFKMMPPLSFGWIIDHAAVVIDESESVRGQVLLIGGTDDEGESVVRKVDLATGVCTAQPSLLCLQWDVVGTCCIAGGLPDGRIVCVGTTRSDNDTLDNESFQEEEEVENADHTMAQVLEPPPHGSPSKASWQSRAFPGTSVFHANGGKGCV
jgi:hypothetical protein